MSRESVPIVSLLQRSEGDTLDFKQENYSFSGASEEEKSELLKDILCLANAWKESDAFIVIGIEERHGRCASIKGVPAALNDSDVQQFVNSKTNRPVAFSIEHLDHDGKNLTIIRVKRTQARPIFLKRNYGRLRSNVVYIRHGSSSEEASPDEIKDMARDDRSKPKEPDVAVSFGITTDYWSYSNSLGFGASKGETHYIDSFNVIVINRGNALAQYIKGSVTLPRGILFDYVRTVKDTTSLASFAATKPIKFDFSNYLREPTANIMMKPNPLEWKPLLPGTRMHLLHEKVVPFRERLRELDATFTWELAVDNCPKKIGATPFSELVVEYSESDD